MYLPYDIKLYTIVHIKSSYVELDTGHDNCYVYIQHVPCNINIRSKCFCTVSVKCCIDVGHGVYINQL